MDFKEMSVLGRKFRYRLELQGNYYARIERYYNDKWTFVALVKGWHNKQSIGEYILREHPEMVGAPQDEWPYGNAPLSVKGLDGKTTYYPKGFKPDWKKK